MILTKSAVLCAMQCVLDLEKGCCQIAQKGQVQGLAKRGFLFSAKCAFLMQCAVPCFWQIVGHLSRFLDVAVSHCPDF